MALGVNQRHKRTMNRKGQRIKWNGEKSNSWLLTNVSENATVTRLNINSNGDTVSVCVFVGLSLCVCEFVCVCPGLDGVVFSLKCCLASLHKYITLPAKRGKEKWRFKTRKSCSSQNTAVFDRETALLLLCQVINIFSFYQKLHNKSLCNGTILYISKSSFFLLTPVGKTH